MQKIKYPMYTLRLSQGYGVDYDSVSVAQSGGNFSHTGSLALDSAGEDLGKDWLYAPCDIECIRHYKGTGYNATWYINTCLVQSADEKIWQPRSLVFLFLHANDDVINSLGVKVGKTFKQGEKCYREGSGGGVGNHAHIEVGSVPFSGTGWHKNGLTSTYGEVYEINNKLVPSDIFYLTENTVVKADLGYNWRYIQSNNTVQYPSDTYVTIKNDSSYNTEYFATASVDTVIGILPKGTSYKALSYTTMPDENNFTYIQFIFDNGQKFWLANLDDRVEINGVVNPDYPDDVEFTEQGIDVSDYQGEIDWSKVSKEKSFTINKAIGTNSAGIYISKYFERNYTECKKYGIKQGAYLYSYAFNEVEAEIELQLFLKAIEGKQFEYPIVLDIEDPLLYKNCTPLQIAQTTKYMCERLTQEGFYPAIYTYTNFANAHMDMSLLDGFDVFIADYRTQLGYNGDYTIWQYTSDGTVSGINGRCDLDVSYIDYATRIKNAGLNGFTIKPNVGAPEPDIDPIEPDNSKELIADLHKEIDNLNIVIAEKNKIISELNEKLLSLETENTSVSNKVLNMQSQQKIVLKELKKTQSEIARLVAKISQLEFENKSLISNGSRLTFWQRLLKWFK